MDTEAYRLGQPTASAVDPALHLGPGAGGYYVHESGVFPGPGMSSSSSQTSRRPGSAVPIPSAGYGIDPTISPAMQGMQSFPQGYSMSAAGNGPPPSGAMYPGDYPQQYQGQSNQSYAYNSPATSQSSVSAYGHGAGGGYGAGPSAGGYPYMGYEATSRQPYDAQSSTSRQPYDTQSNSSAAAGGPAGGYDSRRSSFHQPGRESISSHASAGASPIPPGSAISMHSAGGYGPPSSAGYGMHSGVRQGSMAEEGSYYDPSGQGRLSGPMGMPMGMTMGPPMNLGVGLGYGGMQTAMPPPLHQMYPGPDAGIGGLDVGAAMASGHMGLGQLPISGMSGGSSVYSLVVRQQPERARLCSFKEENDTIDRRPVDPPPIVQICADRRSLSELLIDSHFFMKATLVQAEPVDKKPETGGGYYPPRSNSGDYDVFPELKLPNGMDATTGESLQTPERLKDLDGAEGAFCIFGRLSIRMPGIYRLRFTLFQTVDTNVHEVSFVVTDPFEVFSPKAFKGMRGSTPLTRHFAAQGFKIKLRADGTLGKMNRRKVEPVAGAPAPSQTTTDSNMRARPKPRTYPPIPAPANVPPAMAPPQPSASRAPPSATHSDASNGFPSASPAYSSFRRDDVSMVSPSVASFQDGRRGSTASVHQPNGHSRPPPRQPTPEPPRYDENGKEIVRLPPIDVAVKQSSIWFANAGLIEDNTPPDSVGYHGETVFKDGIRYGGDDGMAFLGRDFPSSSTRFTAGDGLYGNGPGAPASDLASFSLSKRGAANGSSAPGANLRNSFSGTSTGLAGGDGGVRPQSANAADTRDGSVDQ